MSVCCDLLMMLYPAGFRTEFGAEIRVSGAGKIVGGATFALGPGKGRSTDAGTRAEHLQPLLHSPACEVAVNRIAPFHKFTDVSKAPLLRGDPGPVFVPVGQVLKGSRRVNYRVIVGCARDELNAVG